jgi:predicted AAA+ superfamily ATPase
LSAVSPGWKKSSSGTEIDFVIKDGETAYPVECKASAKFKKSHALGVENYLRLYHLRKGAVVSLAPFERIKPADGSTVMNIPLYCAGHLRQIVTSD